MGIFSRMAKIGIAKANQLLGKMERPELMLEQAIRDKEKQIKEVKLAIQGVIATERQTRMQLERQADDKLTWEHKAESALKTGREDLAVKALKRAEEHGKKSELLEKNWKGQRLSVDKLKQEIIQIEDELADFKRNKDFIIAQSKSAEVKKQIYHARARMSKDNSADDLMARMKAKAERLEFEAEGAEEIAETVSGGDSLEKEFSELSLSGGQSAQVQDKLTQLKARIGK